VQNTLDHLVLGAWCRYHIRPFYASKGVFKGGGHWAMPPTPQTGYCPFWKLRHAATTGMPHDFMPKPSLHITVTSLAHRLLTYISTMWPREWRKIYFRLMTYRVSTTPGNPGNLLEFENPPGNLLEFKWSSWKFLCNDRKLMMWHCLCIEECNIKMLLML